jgi:hypothetical protein
MKNSALGSKTTTLEFLGIMIPFSGDPRAIEKSAH